MLMQFIYYVQNVKTSAVLSQFDGQIIKVVLSSLSSQLLFEKTSVSKLFRGYVLNYNIMYFSTKTDNLAVDKKNCSLN